MRGQPPPGMTEPGRARDPEDRLQIADSSRALLEVRLEVIDCVLVAQMSLLLLQHLRFEKTAYVECCREAALKSQIYRARTSEKPSLEQAGTHDGVAVHLLLALLDRSHAVPDLEADIPHGAHKAFERRRGGRRHLRERLRQQDQHVDVGLWEECTTAVAPNRDECGL